MTNVIMQPGTARLHSQIPDPLFTVLAEEFDYSDRVFDLFNAFFHHESYARSFTSHLLVITKGEDGDPWEVRRLATLMLHHQVLLLPPDEIEEFDFLFDELGLKASTTPLSKLKDAVFDEGYTTTELRDFIPEFRRKLERHQYVHDQIKGYETTDEGLRDFIHLSRQECKLSLARYLFTPEEVVEQILKQVKVSQGKEEMTTSQYPHNEEEAATTLSSLPAYEATILRKLGEKAAIYWVSDDTSSALNALVEYPLTTVALAVKPPGSDIEIEIKRTGRKSAPLNAVYRREGRKVLPCHRLDGGCKHTTLLFEARGATVIARIFRCVHDREAPVGKATSIRWIKTIPTGRGDVPIEEYFTDPESFGQGYDEMREALEACVKAYRKRADKTPLEPTDALDLTQHFLYWAKPGQMTLVGTSSFRLETLARYLGPQGIHSYFEEGLGVAYTAEDARRFVDEIVTETLGVYKPPEIPYQSHEHYVEAVFAVPENRVRADRIYQSILCEIATFWGTLMGIRGYSYGESFVGRNVGLRSVWHKGQWRVEITFMDHDKLHLARKEDHHPLRVIRGTFKDEVFIFGRPGNEISDTGAVDFLDEIYRVDRKVAEKGKAAFFEVLEHAYKKTQDALVNNPKMLSFFHRIFAVRTRDWDTLVQQYLPLAEDPAALASWKEEMQTFLGRKDYEQDLIEEHLEALEEYTDFLKRYAFLYRASL